MIGDHALTSFDPAFSDRITVSAHAALGFFSGRDSARRAANSFEVSASVGVSLTTRHEQADMCGSPLPCGASTSTASWSPPNGTFVFSGFSSPLTYTNGSSVDSATQSHPSVANSFNVRAVNGSFFYTNTALSTSFIFNSTTATMTLANNKL